MWVCKAPLQFHRDEVLMWVCKAPLQLHRDEVLMPSFV
jgi:hypothetical protein